MVWPLAYLRGVVSLVLFQMAAEVGSSRQGLQKALSAKGNPRLDNVNSIMRAMGYQLRPQRREEGVRN